MNPRSAFTLIELVVVIMILGILAAVAAPALLDASTDATAAAELRSAREFLKAVERYEATNGALPKDAGPGNFPSDLRGYLTLSHFKRGSPAGGQYDWDGPPPHAAPRFKVTLPVGTDVATQAFYIKMEAEADDGDSKTGWITASGRTISYWY